MKTFFKDILKRFAVTLVSTILFALFSIFLFQSVISAFLEQDSEETIKGSFLALDLSMNLTDRPAGFEIEDLTREALTNERKPPNFHLMEVIDAIKKAESDPNIVGIFISGSFMPDGYGCGYEAIQELLSSLKAFKQSGKQIVGFFSNPTQLDYLVYSICNELHMDPSGTLILNGLANEQIFLAETFKKYGIGVQVVRVGEFKGAVEPFILSGFSEENRLQISRLLDLRWKNYLNAVSQNRSLDQDELADLLSERFLFSAESCRENGLTDAVTPYGQILDRLVELGVEDEESEEFAHVELIDYVDRPQPSSDTDSIDEIKEAKLAIVYVEGTIVDGWGDDGFSVGGDEIAQRIREVWKNDDFKGLILRVNSPGGSVSGSDTILSELARAKAEGLPVIVSMGSVAASGGYWIAMNSDKIFAGEQTITGSIGVFGLLPNIKNLGESFGLRWDVVKTQPSSDLMSVSRPKSVNELAVVQEYVDRIYERFISLVSLNRDLNISRVGEIAEGRVWMGADAFELGLVDELGTLKDAVSYTAKAANLGADYKVIEFPKVKNQMDVLNDIFNVNNQKIRGSVSSSGWSGFFNEINILMNQIKSFNDPRNSYTLLPWYRGSFGFSKSP
jgi:protease-4